MSESLSNRVARFMQKQPARRGGKARAAVIALRDEIQNAMDDGWSVMAIWQTLHAEGSVEVGYHAFRRHVTELLRPRVPEPTREAPTRTRDAAVKTADHPRTFQHNRLPQKGEIYG